MTAQVAATRAKPTPALAFFHIPILEYETRITANTIKGVKLEGVGHAKENGQARSEEHTSELQSQSNLVCRLLLEKKKKNPPMISPEHTSPLPTQSSIVCPLLPRTTPPS